MINITADVPINQQILSELRYAIDTALSHLSAIDADVNLWLCDDEAIRDLNQRYRGVDDVTDCLSFPMGEPDCLGDIAISVSCAQRQADAAGHSLMRELMILCIHSTLHLLGFDHQGSGATMFSLQDTILDIAEKKSGKF